MIWDIGLRRKDLSEKQIIEKIKVSGFKNGEIIIKDKKFYWCQNFLQYKKNYLRDYPNIKELYEYKKELENPDENIVETEDLDYDSQMSECDSDDSQFTKVKKLKNKANGKRKAELQLEKSVIKKIRL